MAFILGCGILCAICHSVCDMALCVGYGTLCGIWHSLRDMALSVYGKAFSEVGTVCDMALGVCIY